MKTLFTEAQRCALREARAERASLIEAGLPHADVVQAVQAAYSQSQSGIVATKDVAAAAGIPVSKMASKLKAAEKAGVVKSRVVRVRSRSNRPSGTTSRHKQWWVPRAIRQKYGISVTPS